MTDFDFLKPEFAYRCCCGYSIKKRRVESLNNSIIKHRKRHGGKVEKNRLEGTERKTRKKRSKRRR